MSQKRTVSVVLPEKTIKTIEIIAKDQRRSRSLMTELLIEEGLKGYAVPQTNHLPTQHKL